jgi:hypothetical protein
MLRHAKPKPEPFDYFRERDALENRYNDLIEKAGITAQVERCGRVAEPDYCEDRHLPPLFTKARTEARKRQQTQKFQSYRHCLRRVIFAVKDENLRRELISLERKFRDLKLRSFQNDLSEARKRLNNAGKPERYSSVFASVGGAIIVALGWQFGGAVGGTAGAVFAVIAALYGLHELDWSRTRNIQRATEEVADAEATVNEIVDQEVFIQIEEDTGEVDEEFTREQFTL